MAPGYRQPETGARPSGRDNGRVTQDPAGRVRPPSPDQAPGFLLLALGQAMRTAVEDELEALGIGLRHYAALGHLLGTPGLSYSELARRGRITVQSMQATLLQLERLGAVERRSRPGRGRTAELHVTEHGQHLVAGARAAYARAEQHVLGPLSGPDRQQLAALLGQLLPALSRDAPAPRG